MGQKKATMTDVAKLSGVSQSTVSLVLNQKSRGAIPPETVSKVLSAAQALHYTKPPRHGARPGPNSRYWCWPATPPTPTTPSCSTNWTWQLLPTICT